MGYLIVDNWILHIFRMRKLDCFEASSKQIGDKAFYVITEDTIIRSTPVKGHKPLLGFLRHPKYGADNLPSRKALKSQAGYITSESEEEQIDEAVNDEPVEIGRKLSFFYIISN